MKKLVLPSVIAMALVGCGDDHHHIYVDTEEENFFTLENIGYAPSKSDIKRLEEENREFFDLAIHKGFSNEEASYFCSQNGTNYTSKLHDYNYQTSCYINEVGESIISMKSSTPSEYEQDFEIRHDREFWVNLSKNTIGFTNFSRAASLVDEYSYSHTSVHSSLYLSNSNENITFGVVENKEETVLSGAEIKQTAYFDIADYTHKEDNKLGAQDLYHLATNGIQVYYYAPEIEFEKYTPNWIYNYQVNVTSNSAFFASDHFLNVIKLVAQNQ